MKRFALRDAAEDDFWKYYGKWRFSFIETVLCRQFQKTETFRLLWIFCFRNHYSIPLSPWDGMCRPGIACADCAVLSWSNHFAESIMLVFSRDGSYVDYRDQPDPFLVFCLIYSMFRTNAVTVNLINIPDINKV